MHGELFQWIGNRNSSALPKSPPRVRTRLQCGAHSCESIQLALEIMKGKNAEKKEKKNEMK